MKVPAPVVSVWRLWLAVFLCLAGCRTAPAPREPLPDLPSVDTAGLAPAVRDAVEGALRAARGKPDDGVAAAKLGMVLQAHNRYGEAGVCYRRAQLLDPGRFEYAYLRGTALAAEGKTTEALAALGRALELSRDSLPARLKLADTLVAAGRTEEAQAEYRKATAQGGNATAWYGLGRAQDRAKDTKGAIVSYEKALALFPRYGAAQLALAEAYRKTGQAGKAEAALKGYEQNKGNVPVIDDPFMAAVYAQDMSTAAMLRRAEDLDGQGRLEEAIALEEEALRQDPKLARAWIHLISLEGRAGHPDEAEAAFKKAVALAPDQPGAYYNLGVLRLAAERYPEAWKAFEKTVQLDPGHAKALRNLGTLSEQEGQPDRAAGFLQRALAVMPEFRAARFQLGRVYANQERYAEAAAQFRQALEPVDSDTPLYRYTLAVTLARLNKRDQAAAEMRKAREEAMQFGLTDLVHAIDRALVASPGHVPTPGSPGRPRR